MEGTPRAAPSASSHNDTSKPKVLWSSAKKSKRSHSRLNASAEKENANVTKKSSLPDIDTIDIKEVEANLHSDFESVKVPRWLRKRMKMQEASAVPEPAPVSDAYAFTSTELLSAIPREHQILRPKFRPPRPDFQEIQLGSTVTDYIRQVSSLSRVLFQASNEPTQDDFYLNVLASHPSKPIVACATLQNVVLYQTKAIQRRIPISQLLPEDYITSLAWTSSSNIAVGTSDAKIHIYDVSTSTCIRTISSHEDRVGSLATADHILSSGSRDASIRHHDLRLSRATVGTSRGHSQEVCGLSYTRCGSTLASGANDNLVNLWDIKKGLSTPPQFQLSDHLAAVKALAWCPWESPLLATGGGTADRTIKCWNTRTGMLLHSTQTHAQVSALVWSCSHKELLSAHGFQSPAMTLWSYPSMQKVKSLSTRSGRILSLTTNGSHIISWCSEGTLRQWDIFLEPHAPPRSSMSDANDENAGVKLPRH
ncbi:unnamed protein product [Aphanomyces euteiches]|nr:hypothetical protein AeRB84_001688 [Aphanomyces euteiches]